MPARPRRPCAEPGCGVLVRRGRCDEHRQARQQARRQRRGSRPYDRRAWRDRIRPAQLRRQPLCEACKEDGITEPATEVDHINGDPWDNRSENLRSLCKPCHSSRTSREQVHAHGRLP